MQWRQAVVKIKNRFCCLLIYLLIKKINIGNILNVKIALSKIKGAPPMKNSIRTVIVSTILLTIFSCTTSTDVPLPITTTSEDALELYNKAWYSWGNHDGIKQSEYMKRALEIDPDFILANLYVIENDPNMNWTAFQSQFKTELLKK